MEAEALSSRIAQQLKQDIFSGTLKPGERLNEAALAEKMNTSRGPVREAIRILDGFGLVTAFPRRGVFVRELSVREMIEISDLRALVFGYAAGLAAEQCSEGDRARLRQVLEEMELAVEGGNKNYYYDLNLEFHGIIIGLAQNVRARNLYDSFVKELHLWRRQDFENSFSMRQSFAEHFQIYEAIASGNKVEATSFAEQHVLAGCQRMLRMGDQIVPA